MPRLIVDPAAGVSDAGTPPIVAHADGVAVSGDVLGEGVEVERRLWEDALQVAQDRDVVYGDGTVGPARLLRDPVDILADHHARMARTARTAGMAAEDVDDL